MPKTINLRSDTVTQPTLAMRQAMANAEVGDDVFSEDPTVNRLQETAAELMGKEAALLVTSGTMGNLIGLLTHCQRGDEVIVGDQAHVFWYEVAGAASVGGLQLRTVPNINGGFDVCALKAAFRGPDTHFPRTALLCLENTHNRCGGAVLTAEETRSLCKMAHERDAKVHLDGARLFNAAVRLGIPAHQLTTDVDSVTFCLSKGLAAPVGSLLCGSAAYIARARKLRKMLGGGMRQAGVIAAAGLVALEQMVERLAEDHENARILAEGLATIEGIDIDPSSVATNIVIFAIADQRFTPREFLASLQESGVKALSPGGRMIRMVTHYGISSSDIEIALRSIRHVMG